MTASIPISSTGLKASYETSALILLGMDQMKRACPAHYRTYCYAAPAAGVGAC